LPIGAAMTQNEVAQRQQPCLRPGKCPYLTDREIEVLLLAAEGMPNRRIARSLGIGLRTAEQHVETMLRRTGASSRGELIARSFVTGVLRTGTWPPAWSGKHCLALGDCAHRIKPSEKLSDWTTSDSSCKKL
jgi:DNA-binding CsgD family transcriptional regulator